MYDLDVTWMTATNRRDKMTTTSKTPGKYLGEYGTTTLPGHPVYDVYLVRGHYSQIKRLWAELDRVAGSSDEPAVILRLVNLGAAVRQG